jgi:hypothetical protein
MVGEVAKPTLPYQFTARLSSRCWPKDAKVWDVVTGRSLKRKLIIGEVWKHGLRGDAEEQLPGQRPWRYVR